MQVKSTAKRVSDISLQVSRLQGYEGGGTNRAEQQVAHMVFAFLLTWLTWLPYSPGAHQEPGLYVNPHLATVPVFLVKSCTAYNPIYILSLSLTHSLTHIPTLLCPDPGVWMQALGCRAGDSAGETADAEYEVKLILHRGAGEQRPACDHLIEDAAHAPKHNTKSSWVTMNSDPQHFD
ncbi:Parapinopsin [Merluccius polli]|uniref:Parapinopsin n=1 Tax=Merluccius polli TaxID=89951 RepID=A0AA47N4R0_MERPO|nr:Parapinopsin [Merluccius polli]